MRCFDRYIKSALLVTLVLAALIFSAQNMAFAEPCLGLSPDTVEFIRPLYFEILILDTQFVMVHNCGDGELSWVGEQDVSWIGFAPTEGGNFDSVGIWIVVSGLPDIFTPPPEGDTVLLEGTITFEAPGALHSPRTVLIRLWLVHEPLPECYLVVEPQHIEHHLSMGDMVTDSIHIIEGSGMEVAVSFYNSSSWLVTPVYFAPPYTPMILPATIITDGLQPGIYFDTLSIYGWLDDTISCGERHIPVVLHVDSVGFGLAASPPAFEYHLQRGQIVTGDSLLIYEMSGQSINFWTSNSEYWLYVDTMASSPLYTPDVIYLNADPDTLPFGTYADTIWVDAAEIPYPMAVPVWMIVHNDGDDYVVETSPPHLYQWLEQDSEWLDSLHVYEIYGRSVGFVFENTQPWLTVEPLCQMPPYNTPRTLIVQFNTEGLDPGEYIDTIFIGPDPDYDTLGFAPIAVPVILGVTGPSLNMVVTPERFDFWLEQSDTLETGLLVYEQHGDSVAFSVELTGTNNWIYLREPGSGGWITPDSVRFYVFAIGLEPGIYSDTIIVFNPLDNDYPYFEIRVPVTLTVDGDSLEFLVATSPEAFEFYPGDELVLYDSLHVYEIHGHNIGFMHENKSHWLVVNPLEMLPLTTPLTMPIVVHIDTMPFGHFRDTIFIYPGYGPYYFPPVAVPVDVIVGDGMTRGDANLDDAINVGDAVYLINYIFKFGPPPRPLEAGDANCDEAVNVGDAVYLINYVFRSGVSPFSSCID